MATTKTSIIVSATAAVGGKTYQKTITDVNPEASNAQLKAFAQGLIGLITDTYVSTYRIDKTSCDED